MALLVTLFLVLVNIFNNVTTNTPKAEGLTAIEAWMLACILFVFATLAEYAGLLFHKMNLFIGTTEKTKGGSYVVSEIKFHYQFWKEICWRKSTCFYSSWLDLWETLVPATASVCLQRIPRYSEQCLMSRTWWVLMTSTMDIKMTNLRDLLISLGQVTSTWEWM